jgi:hypothetical protein
MKQVRIECVRSYVRTPVNVEISENNDAGMYEYDFLLSRFFINIIHVHLT